MTAELDNLAEALAASAPRLTTDQATAIRSLAPYMGRAIDDPVQLMAAAGIMRGALRRSEQERADALTQEAKADLAAHQRSAQRAVARRRRRVEDDVVKALADRLDALDAKRPPPPDPLVELARHIRERTPEMTWGEALENARAIQEARRIGSFLDRLDEDL